MDAAFCVKFTPTDSRTDYHEAIACITEKDTFTVPINTIGARGIAYFSYNLKGFIDIPNEVKFEATAVKCNRKIAITVRNKGNNTSNFSLTTNPSNIFKISPAACSLGIGESQRLEFTFIPQVILLFLS